MRIGVMAGDITRALFEPPATRRYPFERGPEPERLRGKLQFKAETCTGCRICARDCPADALDVVVVDKKAKRFVLRFYVDRCTFCAQCRESCKFDSIALSNDQWELAALERGGFTELHGREDDVAAVTNGNGAAGNGAA